MYIILDVEVCYTNIENIDSVNGLKQQISSLVGSTEFEQYMKYTRENHPYVDKNTTVYNELVKNTRIAVWGRVITSIEQLQAVLQDRKNKSISDDAKEFIQTLIDGINIMDDDMKNIDEYINDDFELGFFIPHDELTTRGIFSRVMSWYIEYKLKIMGITVISELSNDIAQGYQTFTTLLSKKYKLYIVHPSKRHSYDTDKRPMPAGDHIKSEQVSLIRSPNGTYSDSICIDSTTATHMKDQSKEIHKTTDYIVTEYDPKDRKDTLNDYMYFVKDVYENVFDIIFQDNVSRYSEFNSDTRIDTGGALFIYGQVVTTLPRALAVLCLFANNLLTGVKSTITLRIPDSLRDVAKIYITKKRITHLNEHGAKQLLDRLVKGGKKRSSKKTYKARIKSNNRNKNRSRRSRTKYNKNTARRHNNSGTIFL